MGLTPQPRYRQVAQTLINEIQSGRPPVGDLLPTEMTLCQQFGASRFTVRQAINELFELGLVSRQAGVGTRVLAAQPRPTYRQVAHDISDLRQYAADTELEIIDTAMVVVKGGLCELLDAGAGENWLRVEALRKLPDCKAAPICFTEIYIHPAFRAVQGLGDRSATPVYMRIEEQFGERIGEIQQEIKAGALTKRIAGLLSSRPGSPALIITRAYHNRRGEIIELAISTHPADRFSYSQTFRRDWSGGTSSEASRK
jgi:GntR family transcriptional regulator